MSSGTPPPLDRHWSPVSRASVALHADAGGLAGEVSVLPRRLARGALRRPDVEVECGAGHVSGLPGIDGSARRLERGRADLRPAGRAHARPARPRASDAKTARAIQTSAKARQARDRHGLAVDGDADEELEHRRDVRRGPDRGRAGSGSPRRRRLERPAVVTPPADEAPRVPPPLDVNVPVPRAPSQAGWRRRSRRGTASGRTGRGCRRRGDLPLEQAVAVEGRASAGRSRAGARRPPSGPRPPVAAMTTPVHCARRIRSGGPRRPAHGDERVDEVPTGPPPPGRESPA